MLGFGGVFVGTRISATVVAPSPAQDSLVVDRVGLANARRKERKVFGDEVVVDAVGKQMIRKIPNTFSMLEPEP